MYLAYHVELEEYRAVKVVPKSIADYDTFRKEALFLKTLRHPGIPIVYDVEEDTGYSYLIEEYLEGESLYALVKRLGSLSVKTAVNLGIQICRIIQFMNSAENPILYLDLQPKNLLVCNGVLRLTDFDHAQYASDAAAFGERYGTIGFAAPEQYNREKAVIQSDIYSLGMVILFMVSHGHIVTDENHKLSEISSRYSSLYHVINKSLHHEWGLRYSSVTYLKQELQSIMNWGGGTDEKLSYIIQVAGDKAGIGTTHTVMCMAHFLKKKGINCVVADRSGSRRVMPAFVKEGLMDDGSYIYKGIRIIPDYNNAISVTGIKAEVILVDSGHNMRCLMHDKCIVDMVGDNYSYTMVYVTGKHIYEEKKRFAKCSEDIVYMLNLVSAEQFYELSVMFKGKKCYRMPCIYDWCGDNPIFDETMNDFLQDNLSGLWKVYRPGRIKECIGRLYEKISSIRYIKRFKKKKSE